MTADNRLIVAGGTGGTGLAYFAPTGTTLPTTATAALNVAFQNAGLISEDGATLKFDKTVKEIKSYGSNQVQRVLETDSKTSFDVTFQETNAVSIALYSGRALTAVTIAGDGSVATVYGASTPTRYCGVLEIIDGTNLIRLVYPQLEVSSRKERKIAAGEVDLRGVTFTAYPDTSGNACYEYAVIGALAGS